MPTYEYICSKCGHHFDQFQSMNDAHLKKCPKCKKAGLKRLIGGGAGLIFKGTGFYITDYKKSPSKKEEGDSKSVSGDSKSASAPASAPPPTSGAKAAEAPAKAADTKPAGKKPSQS